jgi:hypothetical protein
MLNEDNSFCNYLQNFTIFFTILQNLHIHPQNLAALKFQVQINNCSTSLIINQFAFLIYQQWKEV